MAVSCNEKGHPPKITSWLMLSALPSLPCYIRHIGWEALCRRYALIECILLLSPLLAESSAEVMPDFRSSSGSRPFSTTGEGERSTSSLSSKSSNAPCWKARLCHKPPPVFRSSSGRVYNILFLEVVPISQLQWSDLAAGVMKATANNFPAPGMAASSAGTQQQWPQQQQLPVDSNAPAWQQPHLQHGPAGMPAQPMPPFQHGPPMPGVSLLEF